MTDENSTSGAEGEPSPVEETKADTPETADAAVLPDGNTAEADGKSTSIEDFVKRWGLDSSCEASLLSLSEAQCKQVIADFAPKPETRNMSTKFLAFVRARANTASKPSGMPAEELAAFTEKWSLSERSAALIRDLSPETQRAVVSRFNPPEGTSNHDTKLAAFARIQANQRRNARALAQPAPEVNALPIGAGPPVSRVPVPPGLQDVPAARPTAPPGLQATLQEKTEEKDETSAFAAFTEKWGLDQGSIDALRDLPDSAQQEVIASFSVRAGTKNVNTRFRAYVRSKAGVPSTSSRAQGSLPGKTDQGGVAPGAIRRFAERWSLDSEAQQLLRQIPPEVCSGVLASFNPTEATQNVNAKLRAFVRMRMQNSKSIDPIRQFLERWGLGPKAETALRSLPPDQLAVVLHEFRAPAGSTNVEGKLMGFVRATTSRGAGGASASTAGAVALARGIPYRGGAYGTDPYSGGVPGNGWTGAPTLESILGTPHGWGAACGVRESGGWSGVVGEAIGAVGTGSASNAGAVGGGTASTDEAGGRGLGRKGASSRGRMAPPVSVGELPESSNSPATGRSRTAKSSGKGNSGRKGSNVNGSGVEPGRRRSRGRAIGARARTPPGLPAKNGKTEDETPKEPMANCTDENPGD